MTIATRLAIVVLLVGWMSTAASAESLGVLRLDQTSYRPGDCISATLYATALGQVDPKAGSWMEIAATDGVKSRGPAAQATLRETRPRSGVFRSGCTKMTTAPGDAIVAVAHAADGRLIAIGLASVAGGNGAQRFQAVVDPSAAQPDGQPGQSRRHTFGGLSLSSMSAKAGA